MSRMIVLLATTACTIETGAGRPTYGGGPPSAHEAPAPQSSSAASPAPAPSASIPEAASQPASPASPASQPTGTHPPARFENGVARPPGPRLTSKPARCDLVHDHCLNSATWFAQGRRGGYIATAYELEGNFYRWAAMHREPPLDPKGSYRVARVHRTRPATLADLKPGTLVVVWDLDDPIPSSTFQAQESGRWAFATVASVDQATRTITFEGTQKPRPLESARAIVESRAL